MYVNPAICFDLGIEIEDIFQYNDYISHKFAQCIASTIHFTLKGTSYLREERVIQRPHYLGAIRLLTTVEIKRIVDNVIGRHVQLLSSGNILP